MPAYAYLDASAIAKLVVAEAETAALGHYAAGRAGLVTSRLGATEVVRAARRAGGRRLSQQIDEVLEAFVLVEATAAILTRAGLLNPHTLRTLDAIHLATALSLDIGPLEFVTYDARLATAAAAVGLNVRQPQ